MSHDILQVSPTRSVLLEIRKKTKLAKKGHSLLKKKQDVLINEFFERVKEYKEAKESIMKTVRESYKRLTLDIAYTGIYVSRSVSYATKPVFDIEYTSKNIMGLKLPQIKAVKKDNIRVSNNYENSPLLADATRSFHELFSQLVKLSSMELAIKSLSEEIKKIKRRVNSLEHIQIPRLENTQRYISFTLDEQERDNFIRLKTIKNRMEQSEA